MNHLVISGNKNRQAISRVRAKVDFYWREPYKREFMSHFICFRLSPNKNNNNTKKKKLFDVIE